jgi:hypothetical protein
MTDAEKPTPSDDTSDLPRAIGAPATRALLAAGSTSLASLDGVSRAALERVHGVGPKALWIIDEELARRGTSLG